MKFKPLHCRYYEETFIKRMTTCFLMKPREISSHVKRLWIWDLKYIHTILGKGKVLELYVQYEIDTMELALIHCRETVKEKIYLLKVLKKCMFTSIDYLVFIKNYECILLKFFFRSVFSCSHFFYLFERTLLEMLYDFLIDYW